MKFRIGLKEGEQYSLKRFWKNMGFNIVHRADFTHVELIFIFLVIELSLGMDTPLRPDRYLRKGRHFWWLRIRFMVIYRIIDISVRLPLPIFRWQY